MRAGAVIAERFEVLATAGAGDMGAVWRARDRNEDQDVALKFMLGAGDDDTVRFAREPSALRELSHSGIRRHVADGVTEAVLGSPALL